MTTYLIDHAYFTNENEIDDAVKHHVSTLQKDLNDTDRSVLDMIRLYSAKYGAAQLNYGTIEKGIEKSNATVRRTIRKLESLGIIERIHFIRPVMSGLGANIYVIKPFNSSSSGKGMLLSK